MSAARRQRNAGGGAPTSGADARRAWASAAILASAMLFLAAIIVGVLR